MCQVAVATRFPAIRVASIAKSLFFWILDEEVQQRGKGMERNVLLGAMLAAVIWTLPALAMPHNIKTCVMRTAESIRTAATAADLQRQLANKVHTHILGSRTYKRLWTDIKAQGKTAAAINRYLEALYYRGLADSKAYQGKTPNIAVVGLDGVSHPWNSHDRNRVQLTAYHVKVSISTSSMPEPTLVIVMAMLENGHCKFGDISLVNRGSQIWFSNNVDSSRLNLQQHGN